MNSKELVKALLSASTVSTAWGKLMQDAAAAIEDLQAEVHFWEAAVKGQEDGIKVLQTEVKRLKECNDELREKQTYADHNGDKWRTGGKDILQSAYDHGYMDGWDKANGVEPPQEVQK